MKYVNTDGEEGTLMVGEVPCGVGFQSITLTYDDIADPFFTAWFFENIHCRFANVTKSTH